MNGEKTYLLPFKTEINPFLPFSLSLRYPEYLTCDGHDTDGWFPGHGETEQGVVVVDVGKLGDQGESLVQLPGESLASLAVLGQPQVVVGGQQDVAQRPPGGVRGQRVGLHAVDDGGHTQVDVGG